MITSLETTLAAVFSRALQEHLQQIGYMSVKCEPEYVEVHFEKGSHPGGSRCFMEAGRRPDCYRNH